MVERSWTIASSMVAATFTSGGNVVPLVRVDEGDRARGTRDEGEVEGEVLDLPPLTSTNDKESSGGETRTLNLAVNSRLLCH